VTDANGVESDVLHPTFHGAACARGLLASNSLWERNLGDAAREFTSRRRFAFFFAATIVHGQPPDPLALLERPNPYWADQPLFDKIILPPSHGTETDTQKAERRERVLRRLEYYFRQMGKSCAAVGLPAPSNYNHERMEEWVTAEIDEDTSHVSSQC
jgi:hypothetical protein